jgi:acyl carrier protein
MAPRDDNTAGLRSSALLPTVRGCMQRVLELGDEETASIGADTTPLVLPRWTSLTHVQLILELERTFDVVFDADDIAALASVSAIVRSLERLTS